MAVQILFVLLFLVINVQAKTYYINDVCRFQTSSSLICEWVNEGNYTEREPNINHRHVEHIDFNRLQNSSIEWRTLLCKIVCKANGEKSSKSSKLFTCVYF